MSETQVKGRLIVVGTGIHREQVTLESLAVIAAAKKLIIGSHDSKWVLDLNPAAECLDKFRDEKQETNRRDEYHAMVDHVLSYLRQGEDVCLGFYGDAAVATYPARIVTKRAQEEGIEVVRLPGISSVNALWNDLNVDPAAHGCAMMTASDYLLNPSKVGTSLSLILWQIQYIGEATDKKNPAGIKKLKKTLRRRYGSEHVVTLYEAAQIPACRPTIIPIPISKLSETHAYGGFSLYVPPKGL